MVTLTDTAAMPDAGPSWNPDEALDWMRLAHESVEAKRLPPDLPAIDAPAARVVDAWKRRDLRGVELGCCQIVAVCRTLPVGAFEWSPRPREEPGPNGE